MLRSAYAAFADVESETRFRDSAIQRGNCVIKTYV